VVRRQAGSVLVWASIGAIPIVFFLAVAGNPILAGAAVCVELGLFTAVRLALRPPAVPRPPGPRLGTPRDPLPPRRRARTGRP
jgi:hypothetical protein